MHNQSKLPHVALQASGFSINLFMLFRTCILILVAGCDIKTADDADDFGSYYTYPDNGGYELQRHTLIGHLEVLDSGTETPLSQVRIEGWIYYDSYILDSFVVRTNAMGLARIDVTTFDTQHPYSLLEIRILEPGYRPFSTSLPIHKIDTLMDERGAWTTIYETGGSFYLSPL